MCPDESDGIGILKRAFVDGNRRNPLRNIGVGTLDQGDEPPLVDPASAIRSNHEVTRIVLKGGLNMLAKQSAIVTNQVNSGIFENVNETKPVYPGSIEYEHPMISSSQESWPRAEMSQDDSCRTAVYGTPRGGNKAFARWKIARGANTASRDTPNASVELTKPHTIQVSSPPLLTGFPYSHPVLSLRELYWLRIEVPVGPGVLSANGTT